MTTCNKNLDELSIEELQKLFERQSEEIKSIESMSNDDKLEKGVELYNNMEE